ncbi:hypothetical protein WJX84_003129 [Apatococcus fuscideae]|uniref:Secreted protein n=1 Tax=Apatococcus fuscideae TaxID=2026836 RepID=A0AAW1SS67_9CHLO
MPTLAALSWGCAWSITEDPLRKPEAASPPAVDDHTEVHCSDRMGRLPGKLQEPANDSEAHGSMSGGAWPATSALGMEIHNCGCMMGWKDDAPEHSSRSIQ